MSHGQITPPPPSSCNRCQFQPHQPPYCVMSPPNTPGLMSHQTSVARFLTAVTQCHTQASKPPSCSSPHATYGPISMSTGGPVPASSVNARKCTGTQSRPQVPSPCQMPCSTMCILISSVLFHQQNNTHIDSRVSTALHVGQRLYHLQTRPQ